MFQFLLIKIKHIFLYFKIENSCYTESLIYPYFLPKLLPEIDKITIINFLKNNILFYEIDVNI